MKIYKCHKTSLKSIVKDVSYLEIINKATINVNKLVIHTYNMLKLYYLHNYLKCNTVINIDLSLLRTICKVMCSKDARGRGLNVKNQKSYDDIEKFYNKYYKKIMTDDITLSYLSNVIEYELVSMLTNIKNHIINNFYEFINRYINVATNKQQLENDIEADKSLTSKEKKSKITMLRAEILLLKHDIFNCTTTCQKKYYDILDTVNKMLPRIPQTSNVIKHVHKDPIAFLPMLIKFSIQIEKRGLSTINCFPLRKNITPKYITLDTTTLIYMLPIQNRQMYVKNISLLGDNIWDLFFRTEKKEFKSSTHVFNNQIITDGIGCSILLVQKEYKGQKIRHIKKPKDYKSGVYIDEISDIEKKRLKASQIIGIDPGKDDLIYATNGTMKNGKMMTFRYSQNQRRKETKSKKYRDILNKDRKTNKVFKEESKLSDTNSKSCILKNVKTYLRVKNTVNKEVHATYEKTLYRTLKWYSFINRKRTESKMLTNFKDKFDTDSKDTVLCIGDFEQKKQMKYKEPTKGKSFRNLFKQVGYKVYLVDEYKTSLMSYFTQTENEKFRKRGNPRPWKDGLRLWHGLLRSKNVTNNGSSTSNHILVNRDLNGALNIRLKGLCSILNKKIPKYMARSTQ